VSYTSDTLLECLGDQRLTSSEWKKICAAEFGVSHGKFFELLKELEQGEEVIKSAIDRKWQRVHQKPRSHNREKDE
jgi:hypothetical protein